MQTKYLKYQIKYSDIYNILEYYKYKKVNFFIDLQGVCKGLYNNDNIFFEINYYIENNKPSFQLVEELKNFYNNNLYKMFKKYDPFIVTFYDDGNNSQNMAINSNYKGGRTSIKNIINDDHLVQLHYEIKKSNFELIKEKLNIPNYGQVYYLKEYESDLIPYYCITNDLFDSNQKEVLNVILALDKDLLQCCEYENTIQCATKFLPSKSGTSKAINFGLYNKSNAISYLHDKFKPGILTAGFIPMLLSIMGDKADNLPGIKGIGAVKAIDIIQNYNIPMRIQQLEQNLNSMPEIIKDNFKLIKNNYKIISFEEQLSRLKTFQI